MNVDNCAWKLVAQAICVYTFSSAGHQGPCTHPEKFNKEQYTFLCEVEKTTIKYVCMLHMLKTPEGKCQQP